jgi:hypothetical protein
MNPSAQRLIASAHWESRARRSSRGLWPWRGMSRGARAAASVQQCAARRQIAEPTGPGGIVGGIVVGGVVVGVVPSGMTGVVTGTGVAVVVGVGVGVGVRGATVGAIGATTGTGEAVVVGAVVVLAVAVTGGGGGGGGSCRMQPTTRRVIASAERVMPRERSAITREAVRGRYAAVHSLRSETTMAWIKVPSEHHPIFRAALPKSPLVETQAMFGGIAAKVNGNLFAGLFGRSVMLALDEKDRSAALALEGAGPFDPMGDGRARSEKVMLPEAMMEEPTELRRWIQRAFDTAAKLPRKAAKPKKAEAARATKKVAAKKATPKKK